MVLRFNKNIFMKSTAILLSLFLIIISFFQPKKVKAVIGVDDAILAATIATALIAGRYVQTNVLYTPEQMNQINEKWTANLQTAFPDPTDYNHQMNVLQNLNQKLLNGEDVDWCKYNGKALYAVLKGVVDVVWPTKELPSDLDLTGYRFIGAANGYQLYFENSCTIPSFGWRYSWDSFHTLKLEWGENKRTIYTYSGGEEARLICPDNVRKNGYISILWEKDKPIHYGSFSNMETQYAIIVAKILGVTVDGANFNNIRCVPSISAKTANKVKLPTRLSQTVINNINNYIDNSTENLIIAPTPEELPALPDNYNPNTDDPPDLPGYEDVTPDQPGTTDPEPTPSPTPEPTPTAPEYDGSKWVNPIGEFIAGLLEFLKSAFVPTMSIDTSPLTNANFDMANKFPFSLPNTFKTLLITVNAPGKTPVFDMTFDMTKLGFEAPIVWHIDLHEWDTGAEIAKTSLYIIFLLGLILMTKKLFVK